MSLPEWINKVSENTYEILGDLIYPSLLSELAGAASRLPPPSPDDNETPWISELRRFDPRSLNQYWLEVIYQMAKLELQRHLLAAGLPLWGNEVHVRATKSKWALKLYPEGRGWYAATKGREARRLYKHLRGGLPQ